jgi:hypothetical protein
MGKYLSTPNSTLLALYPFPCLCNHCPKKVCYWNILSQVFPTFMLNNDCCSRVPCESECENGPFIPSRPSGNCINFEISARARRHITSNRFIQDWRCHPPPAARESLEIRQIKCVVLFSGEIPFAALPALFHPEHHSR